MKRITALLVSILLAACLTACGKETEAAKTPSAAQENPDNAPEETSAPESVPEPAIDNGSVELETSTGEPETSAEESEMSAGEPDASGKPKVLVAYFSATNTTKRVAENIAAGLEAELYEIVPEEPYTEADLNYNDSNSRTTIEMNDPDARPSISGAVSDMEQYDIVFIGYPIWWGEAPRIVSTFMESYDFSGKTIVPFCTSGGSGVGSSDANLAALTQGAEWLPGKRLSGGASAEEIMEWVESLPLF